MSRLSEVRSKAGLTQQGLAQKAGLALNTIVKLESGRADPRLKTARAIASALKVPLDELWPIDSLDLQSGRA